MKTLAQIRRELTAGQFYFSRHALRRATERIISEREIAEAGAEAVIVEQYPHDKYGPSWLILGFTELARPLHIQVSIVDAPLIRIVTVYEPDSDRWENYIRRR